MTLDARRGREVAPDELAPAVAALVAEGGRFAGLVASAAADGATRLRALIAGAGRIEPIEAVVPAGAPGYRALSPLVPAAFWYEREVHDLFGLVPVGHPRLDPLVFPLGDAGQGAVRPRPGRAEGPERIDPDTAALPGHVTGEGVFTIPYGPVRSGVFESVEYLVETFGEDIPQVRVRPYPKHRGVARRFAGLGVADGVLLAERFEGTASVAHATAFCLAIEALAGIDPPEAAQLLRLVHAELERVANHLDTMVRHTEGAGQAVAYARLSFHKERLLRLRARLCGHRFGRGVVVPGGVVGPPGIPPAEALVAVEGIRADLDRDLKSLMATPSFLDRLRTTGVIAPAVAGAHGALGPVGRASATGADVRVARPYGAYLRLGFEPVESRREGDALARQWIRVEELVASWELVGRALRELERWPAGPVTPLSAEARPGRSGPVTPLSAEARPGRSGPVTPLSAEGRPGRSGPVTPLSAEGRPGRSGPVTPLSAEGRPGRSGPVTPLSAEGRPGRSGPVTPLPAEERPGRSGPWRHPVPVVDGTAIAGVEAPHGELLYVVEVAGGRLAQVKPRTASFHNFALFPHAFGGDILTDFVFIEASFGASMAGVAG